MPLLPKDASTVIHNITAAITTGLNPINSLLAEQSILNKVNYVLTNELDHLKEEAAILDKKIAKTKKKAAEVKDKITEVEVNPTQLTALTKVQYQLQKLEYDNLEKEISQLQKKVTELQKKAITLQQHFYSLKNIFDELQETLQQHDPKQLTLELQQVFILNRILSKLESELLKEKSTAASISYSPIDLLKKINLTKEKINLLLTTILPNFLSLSDSLINAITDNAAAITTILQPKAPLTAFVKKIAHHKIHKELTVLLQQLQELIISLQQGNEAIKIALLPKNLKLLAQCISIITESAESISVELALTPGASSSTPKISQLLPSASISLEEPVSRVLNFDDEAQPNIAPQPTAFTATTRREEEPNIKTLSPPLPPPTNQQEAQTAIPVREQEENYQPQQQQNFVKIILLILQTICRSIGSFFKKLFVKLLKKEIKTKPSNNTLPPSSIAPTTKSPLTPKPQSQQLPPTATNQDVTPLPGSGLPPQPAILSLSGCSGIATTTTTTANSAVPVVAAMAEISSSDEQPFLRRGRPPL